MDLQAYLNRIHYHQSPQVNEDTLFNLQTQHLYHVPFENLDIHYGHKIQLSLSHLYHKIVVARRGGFCYELNGLFYHLLKSIGFSVRMVSARVFNYDNGYSPEFDHMTLIVTLNDREYLVDVGFGRFSLAPLPIETGQKFAGIHRDFQFDHYNQQYWRINEVVNDKLVPAYIFKPEARQLHEFEPMCNYHQNSPDSHFAANKMISKATPEGRITLTNQQLKITQNNREKLINFAEEEFEAKLNQYFNIVISVPKDGKLKG